MKKTLRAFAAIVAGMLLIATLSACGSKAATPLELTSGDSGSTQVLKVGQQLTVTLDSNPSTGYAWAIDGAVPPQLEQSGESKFSSQSDLVGAGGTEVWTFVGAATGTGTLKLKYWRSFEPTVPPTNSFEVVVDVQ